MTDLLDALFRYVEETQLKAYLDADPQYRRAVLQSEQWESDLSDRLDEEGQDLFDRYQRACADEQDCLQRALFRAVLALRRDLDLILLLNWRR